MSLVASSLIAALLLGAAALKAADRPGTVVALATYGLDGRAAAVARWLLVAVEGAAAVALMLGSPAAAGLFAAFAVAQAAALLAGRAGAPCGCLGARGKLSWWGVLRSVALGAAVVAAGAAASPWALLAVPVALLLFAPQRPEGALDVAGEGPELGAAVDVPGEGRRLVVFTAAGCSLCRDLRPALGRVERKSGTEVVEADADAFPWVPGAPYAIMLDADSRVIAKGSVNTAKQLRSLVPGDERADSRHLRGFRRVRPAAAPAERADSREGGGSRRLRPAAPPADPGRRAFLQAAATVAVAPTVAQWVKPGEAEAYHFCGHIYTTDSCPHPTGLPRIDAKGFPLRARDGHPVDDLGRLIDRGGRPVDEDGEPLTDNDGRRLPAATRTRVCTATAKQYRQRMRVDGAWYRCCGGRVRKLVDCCTNGDRRINGDRALRGYCYGRRKVFCVMYYQTKVPC